VRVDDFARFERHTRRGYVNDAILEPHFDTPLFQRILGIGTDVFLEHAQQPGANSTKRRFSAGRVG
jgi:hypothetical protein